MDNKQKTINILNNNSVSAEKAKEYEMEVKELMDDNEMLSYIFLSCIPTKQLIEIKNHYIGTEGNEIDWKKESVKIPVEMKIGNVSVNPKEFFDLWENQMQKMISEKAKELVSEKLGSQKMIEMQDKLYQYEQVLDSWEKEINWEVKNPLID
jgi:hypothetical protein